METINVPTTEESLPETPTLSEEQPLPEELTFSEEFHKEHIGLPRRGPWILIGALLLIVIGVAALVLLLPKKNTMPCFSEVMTSNHAAFEHPLYGTVDWVELYNPTDEPIDLSGFGFTNEIKRTFRYRFPDGTVLEPGAYLVLYCTGGTEASDSDPFCTGFNLSANGEDLYLVNPNNVEADEVHVPALEPDTSYARTADGEFVVTTVPTPGEENQFAQ